jgi:hypothetical protein
MHIFDYSREWGDIVVTQLAVSHNSLETDLWGYACLVLNEKLEEYLEKNYEKVDLLTGNHLHVFTMIPPPRHFVEERCRQIQNSASIDGGRASELFERLRRKTYPVRSIQKREKARLLGDLDNSGFEPNLLADFLFFDFKRIDDFQGVDIDVIAVKTAPIFDYSNQRDIERLFQDISDRAKKSFGKNHRAEEFVDILSAAWLRKIRIKEGTDIATFIIGLLQVFKPT